MRVNKESVWAYVPIILTNDVRAYMHLLFCSFYEREEVEEKRREVQREREIIHVIRF